MNWEKIRDGHYVAEDGEMTLVLTDSAPCWFLRLRTGRRERSFTLETKNVDEAKQLAERIASKARSDGR